MERRLQVIDDSHYILFERGDGKRRYEFTMGSVKIDPKATRAYVYMIVPWLHHAKSNSMMQEYANNQLRRPDPADFH